MGNGMLLAIALGLALGVATNPRDTNAQTPPGSSNVMYCGVSNFTTNVIGSTFQPPSGYQEVYQVVCVCGNLGNATACGFCYNKLASYSTTSATGPWSLSTNLSSNLTPSSLAGCGYTSTTTITTTLSALSSGYYYRFQFYAAPQVAATAPGGEVTVGCDAVAADYTLVDTAYCQVGITN